MAFNKLFGKFKKSEVEDEEEIKVQDYLDMIAPSTIRFYTEYFICGNSYRSVWALREYPTSTDEQALLRYMGEKDGVTLHIYARQVTSAEEKKIIFSRFALPKVLKRIGLQADECTLTEEGLDAVVEIYSNTSGIRDLEQAAEHLAANALYQIEVDGVKEVVFDAEKVKKLFL